MFPVLVILATPLPLTNCFLFAAIPATVVAAASFDDAIAITGYTLFINLAVRGGGNTAWSVAHGPLSLLFGVLAGLVAGFLCSITKLWDNSLKRTLVVFFTSAFLSETLSVSVFHAVTIKLKCLSCPVCVLWPCLMLQQLACADASL